MANATTTTSVTSERDLRKETIMARVHNEVLKEVTEMATEFSINDSRCGCIMSFERIPSEVEQFNLFGIEGNYPFNYRLDQYQFDYGFGSDLFSLYINEENNYVVSAMYADLEDRIFLRTELLKLIKFICRV